MTVTPSLVRNCIVGLIGGAIVGFIGAVISAVVGWIRISLGRSDYNTGEQLGYGIAWLVLFAGPIIGVLAPIIVEFLRQQSQLLAQRAAHHADEQRRREASAAEQCSLILRLSTLKTQCVSSARGLPGLLLAAEAALDRAEEEYREGAFAPFWDAVEEAANTLASFNLTVQTLVTNASHYKSNAAALPTPVPPFDLGVQTLPDPSCTAKRMTGIVRQAQKNFHFATIYEQRKTNQLLVVGFRSFHQAINELGDRLDSSLEALGSSVGTAIEHASADASARADALRDQIARDSEERRGHDGEVRGMLDNIQRRRKPRPQKFRDREY